MSNTDDEPPPKRLKSQQQEPPPNNEDNNNNKDTTIVPQLHHAGITYADLHTTIQVLNAIATLDNTNTNDNTNDNKNAYQHANLRSFRKALAPVIKMQQRSMYNGKTQQQYIQERGEAKYMKGRKAKDTAMQRDFIDKTILRRGRIERLNLLKNDAKDEEQDKLKIKQQQLGMLVPDGVPLWNGQEANLLLMQDNDVSTDTNTNTNNKTLPKPRSCYTCKVRYRTLHAFYDQLCPDCATFNFTKRNFTTNLTGKIAVVTGSRVKIGFQTCLKLLRAGCTVIATTRFPNAACKAYMDLPDFHQFKARLHVYGLDLRDVVALEEFCKFLTVHYNAVDVLINNACQTIRRPVGYYTPAVEREQALYAAAIATEDSDHRLLLEGCVKYEHVLLKRNNANNANGGAFSMLTSSSNNNTVNSNNSNDDSNINTTKAAGAAAAGVSHSSLMSQVALLPEDNHNNTNNNNDDDVLPKGLSDVNGQQLDLRKHNSWLLKIGDVSTPELVETFFINAIAPFVLNSRLKPLMMSGGNARPDRYIINVSAMEGKFYRYKTPNHPHTNMAKAALNMMTRTSAEDLAKNARIYMNSVDTGWINDENPLDKANATAKNNHFQTPIDEVDAAARILDPVFTGVSEGNPTYGLFYKDYKETEW
eukprot:CAMPEP_0116021700 /NCGR_PEP_ID=MMETSP0321-20121206/10549_1 /TAXON_ID=163516 /ORGANISM="Leptocylindrus danicus var. danicus, Strain B650" /LENGTH=645 /DNA_ID=CAMNT_0003492633 /DNA_START=47 /DNA_END=1981 /DNA_ORIENTATION=+